MARHVVVQVSCDVCEATDATSVEFSVDRSAFEIDLCPEHRGQFTNALAPFVSQARSARTRGGAPAASSAPTRAKSGRRDAAQTEAIRAWARENGFQINSRGRIPGHIEAAYNARSGA
jgi:Zn-finger nucleic acid-binding protein